MRSWPTWRRPAGNPSARCKPAWFRDERQVLPGKLTLDHIDATAVTAFLGWLQEGRRNGVSTRNQRLAAINSFCTWMQTEDPVRMACWQDILAIPARKQDYREIGRIGMRPPHGAGIHRRSSGHYFPP